MDNWKRKIKKAVSLKYEPDKDRAPKVVEILSKLGLEEDIPPTVYVLVAEILAFVYRMNERWLGQAAENS
jgi:flagellar biosynthesis protein